MHPVYRTMEETSSEFRARAFCASRSTTAESTNTESRAAMSTALPGPGHHPPITPEYCADWQRRITSDRFGRSGISESMSDMIN